MADIPEFRVVGSDVARVHARACDRLKGAVRMVDSTSCTENLPGFDSLGPYDKSDTIMSVSCKPVARILADFCVSGFEIVDYARGSKGKQGQNHK